MYNFAYNFMYRTRIHLQFVIILFIIIIINNGLT